jgi:death-on-curing protein
MYFFTKGHCFVDGNKRLGVQSAIIFLMLNGYEDYLDDDEGYKKTMEIAALKQVII